MGIKIVIEDRAVREALAGLAGRVADMTPVMHDIGQALVEGIRAHIGAGVDWHGRAFAPNAPATLAKKSGARPLVDTGAFVGQRLHYAAGRNAVVVSSSAAQAAVLQFGARKGSFGKSPKGRPLPFGNIPARPYMPLEGDGRSLSESARTLVLQTISDYLADRPPQE